MKQIKLIIWIFIMAIFNGWGCTTGSAPLQDLRQLLHSEQQWIKVHVAEYLLWTGHPEGVREAFEEKEKQFGKTPKYRIGIWRVLAQVAESAEEKKRYTDQILKAFLDTSGEDRVHAAETLAKLRISPLGDAPDITRETLGSTTKNLVYYTRWSVAYTSADSLREVRNYFFDQLINRSGTKLEPVSVNLSAYILRQLPGLSKGQWQALAASALLEPEASEVKPTILAAAFISIPEGQDGKWYDRLHQGLIRTCQQMGAAGLLQMLPALALNGQKDDLPLLSYIYREQKDTSRAGYDADVHAAAAYAVLKLSHKLAKQK